MSSWNLTIDDSSPSLNFTPSFDWSEQSSSRFTSVDGASVVLQFYGEAIYIYGTASGSYDVTLDNTLLQDLSYSNNNILFNSTNLTQANHYLTLTARSQAPGGLSFDSAVIVPGASTDAPLEVTYDNNNSSALSYSSGWTIASASGIPNTTTTIPYHTTSSQGSSVTFTFSQAMGVMVNGMINSDSGLYTVLLDGASNTYNVTSSMMYPDALLFFQLGLDPLATHNLTIVNSDGNGHTFSLNQITLCQSNISSNSTDSPTTVLPGSNPKNLKISHLAAIIAGSVSGAVALIAIACFFLWFYHRSRRQANGPAKVVQTGDSLVRTLSLGSHRNLDSSRSLPSDASFQYDSDTPFVEEDPFFSTQHHPLLEDNVPRSVTASPVSRARSNSTQVPVKLYCPSLPTTAHPDDYTTQGSSRVIVTNDHRGATVMYWSPNEFMLDGDFVTQSPRYSSLTVASNVNTPSEVDSSRGSRPQSQTSRIARSSVSEHIPLVSLSQSPPAQQYNIRKSIGKRRLHQPLPKPPGPVAQDYPKEADPEDRIEIDAGRFDESTFMHMLNSSTSKALPPSDAPPPEYRKRHSKDCIELFR